MDAAVKFSKKLQEELNVTVSQAYDGGATKLPPTGENKNPLRVTATRVPLEQFSKEATQLDAVPSKTDTTLSMNEPKKVTQEPVIGG